MLPSATFAFPHAMMPDHTCTGPRGLAGPVDESSDGADDCLLLRQRELAVNGERQAFGGRGFGRRKVSAPVAQIIKARLQVKRHRIVDLRPDALLGEVGPEIVAPCGPDDELIEDVAALRRFGWQRDAIRQAGVPEQGAIACRILPAGIGPGCEMRRLDPQDRRLKRVHPEVAADDGVVILRLHAVLAHRPDALGKLGIVGGDEACITECAEILARVKREAAACSDAARRLTLVCGANRLRGILDDRNPGPGCCVGNRTHVGREAEQMDRQDGFCPRRDGGADPFGIDVIGREGRYPRTPASRRGARSLRRLRKMRVAR